MKGVGIDRDVREGDNGVNDERPGTVIDRMGTLQFWIEIAMTVAPLGSMSTLKVGLAHFGNDPTVVVAEVANSIRVQHGTWKRSEEKGNH